MDTGGEVSTIGGTFSVKRSSHAHQNNQGFSPSVKAGEPDASIRR